MLQGFRALLLALILVTPAAASQISGNVLLLYSNGRLLPANIELDQGFTEALGQRTDISVFLSSEFLDIPRFSGEEYERAFATYLRDKYQSHSPNVIATAGDEAIAFAARYRDSLFPGVPVVHMAAAVEKIAELDPLPPDIVGIPVELDFARTIEQALQWRPTIRRLLVVSGASPWSTEWIARIQEKSHTFAGRLDIQFETASSTEAIVALVSRLDDEWLVFTSGYFLDSDGRPSIPRDNVAAIAERSSVPVVGPYATFIGTGVLGGYVPSFTEMGRMGARSAMALLEGKAIDSLDLPTEMPVNLYVDWRQAKRWNIDLSNLPPDAHVMFRQPTFWEQYRTLALLVALVMLVQATLIAALLVERRRRQQIASELAHSEQRMGLAAHAARLSMWIWDLGSEKTWVRRPISKDKDPSQDSFTDFGEVLENIHPDDRSSVEVLTQQTLVDGTEIELEYRVVETDGTVRWLSARGRVDDDGQRLSGVSLDITARKVAELQAEQDRAALRHMTRVSLLGQLSASIAHQLNQPLAAILSNAESAQALLDSDEGDLEELRAICSDIISDDQRAAEIIRSLGALFKHGEPTLAPLGVNELVTDTLELMRANLLMRKILVRTHLEPELPALNGDRVQLQQLLLNLLINASDAMMAIGPDQRQLTVTTEMVGSDIRISVSDTGPGIAEDDLEKLFEPFWSSKSTGMGMGLAICRSVAQAHGGSLKAANRAEGGGEFQVLLPAHVQSWLSGQQ